MRKFFSALWSVITFPFRLTFNIITFPFRKLGSFYRFMNTEPEERPLPEVFADLATNVDTRKILWDQIFSLRFHLFRFVAVFAVFCLVSFLYFTDILNLLQNPLNLFEHSGLRISGPGDIFDIIPKIIFASASVLSAPYLIFEIYLYATPG